MMKKYLLLLFSFCISLVFSQKPIFSQAKVKAVTVYQNSAEISSTTSANIPQGVTDLVITNISPYANENTVRLNISSNLSVLSIQRTDQSSQENEIDNQNPEVKKVRDSIKILEKLIDKYDYVLDNNAKTLDLLEKNKNMLVGSNNASVAELVKLTDYYNNKRNEINSKNEIDYEKQRNLQEKLQKLQNRLSLNNVSDEKIASGKLIFRIMNSKSGVEKIDFSYICNNVSWQPFYELKSEGVSDNIKLTYSAVIQQSTGIDWKNVKLTLVNTSSGQMNVAPTISPWFLYAYKPQPVAEVAPGIRSQSSTANYAVAEVSSSKSYYSTQNMLSTRFDTDIPYDILSNGKNHSVKLMEKNIPAQYKYSAVPKYDKGAYLNAEISDYAQYNLLPGRANIIFENVYVGTAQINPEQTGDKMLITLGKDERINIIREKANDKSDKKTFSSNIEQTYAYNITIRNNKKESVEIEVKDQYPISQNGDVTVELMNHDGATVDAETGILTWKVKLSPSESKKLKIAYKVKYPKDYQIQALN